MAFRFPRRLIAAGGLNPDRLLASAIPATHEAVRLLTVYGMHFHTLSGEMSPGMARLAAAHLGDLAVLAMGAAGDPARAAERGLRAARLKAVKEDILTHLTSSTLSLAQTARRQGISPSYVSKLLAGENTNFTEFVLTHRLERAYRMLTSPRYSYLGIGTIAYNTGFRDLSYFNRCFRRTYRMTPSDLRALATTRRSRPEHDPCPAPTPDWPGALSEE